MNEQEIIFQVLSDIEVILPSAVSVRTRGGDGDASPPLALLEWDSIRLRGEGGHKPLGGYMTDPDSGDQTGWEFHQYRQMEIDVEVRAYDESDRDTWLSDVKDEFLVYEYDSTLFHRDTAEWSVGNIEPRSNPDVEPDWYEGGITIRFKYVSRTQKEADTLTSITEGEESSENTGTDFVWVSEDFGI